MSDEQEVETELPVDTEPTEEDLVKAAEAAMAAEAPEEPAKAKEEAPAPKGLVTEPEATKPAADTEEDRFARRWKEREADQAYREKLRAELAAELRDQVARETAAAREQARKDALEQAKAEYGKRLREDPHAVVREAGDDPADVVRRLAERGTPEGRARWEAEQREAKRAEETAALARELAELKAWREEQAKAAQEAQVRASHTQLLAQFSEEKTPYASAYYDTDEAKIARAQQIAQEYTARTNKPVCPFSHIVSELEREARENAKAQHDRVAAYLAKLAKLQQPAASPESSPAEAKGNGKPPPRSLSPSAGSERRSTPGPMLSDEDTLREAEAQAAALLGPKKPSRFAR